MVTSVAVMCFVLQGLKHDQQYRASPALPGQNSSDSLAHVAAPYYGNLPGLPAHLQTDMPNFNFGTEQAGQLPSDSFVHGPTYYSGNPPGLPAHLHHETPTFSLDQSGRNLVSLHSINSSEGSGMSCCPGKSLSLHYHRIHDCSVVMPSSMQQQLSDGSPTWPFPHCKFHTRAIQIFANLLSGTCILGI